MPGQRPDKKHRMSIRCAGRGKILLTSKLETLIAREIIGHDPAPDTVFTVDYADGELRIGES